MNRGAGEEQQFFLECGGSTPYSTEGCRVACGRPGPKGEMPMATAAPAHSRMLSPEQLEQFQRDGCLVVRGMFSPEEVRELGDAHVKIHACAPIGDFYKHATEEEAAG